MQDTAPPSASVASKWDDLSARILSSLGMVALGAIAVLLGGLWFKMLVAFVIAIMIWELCLMLRPAGAVQAALLAVLTAVLMSGQFAMGGGASLALVLVVPAIGALALPAHRVVFVVFALALQLAGWGLVQFRAEFGMIWLLWLLAVVIASDIFGYFAGKAFGGPKFWPAISPKKTWSGTIAGWIGGACVGAGFAAFTDAGLMVIVISPLVAFAGQMGDIAESALKRRMGVKDSSALIPGHGGLLDRFDAVLGAALFLLVLVYVMRLPGVVF